MNKERVRIPSLFKKGILVFALVFSFCIVNPSVASADSTLITNGTVKIGNFPVGLLGIQNTSWHIDTSDVDNTVITTTSADFFGPSSNGVESTEEWTELVNGSVDDNSVELPFAGEFSVNFNGNTYTSVFIGSNTYFTFGEGSSNLSPSQNSPPFPGVHMCAADNSYQRVIYRYEDGGATLRVRYEGNGSTSGDVGSPGIIYEVLFYAGQSNFDLFVGINNRCSDGAGEATISGVPGPGNLLTATATGWVDPGSLDFTYQWQYYNGEAWVNIEGATSQTYLVTEGDLARQILVIITGSQGELSASRTSGSYYEVDQYPVLEDVDEDNWWDIDSCEKLQEMKFDLMGDYELTSNVDCSVTNYNNENFNGDLWNESGFQPIGSTDFRFQGRLDGNEYHISDLYIDTGSDYTGLFSVIEEGAEVYDLGLENVEVHGNNYTGALAGALSGTVTRVYSTGEVSGNDNVGGLVGYHVAPEGIGSSSPLVFAWNGEEYLYRGDVGRGIPRNTVGDDSLALGGNELQPKDGKYSLQISEEYNEIVYYDELSLTTIDHAPGYNIATTLERNNDDIYTVSDNPSHPLLSCTDEYDNDCLDELETNDNEWSYRDESNINSWTLNFGDLSGEDRILLVLRAAETYSLESAQTVRFVQVKNADGQWVNAYSKAQLSAPAGTPRNQVIDMTGKFLTDNYDVKIGFDKTRINYVAVDTSAQQEYTERTYHPSSADLHFFGYTAIDKEFFWDHDYYSVESTPPELFASQSGNFTRYGDVTDLLQDTDDQSIVMHHGDQFTVQFEYVAPEEGMERDFILYNWATFKHAEMGSAGRTVEPLPFVGMTRYPYSAPQAYPLTDENEEYLRTYNTRVITGPVSSGSTIIDSYSTATVAGNNSAGGLVGYNQKLITGSYANGAVRGYYNVGGLVGQNIQPGVIENSYATGDVTNIESGEHTGGFVGYNESTIRNCYASGDVSGFNYTAGFVGWDNMSGEAVMENSFSTGEVVDLGDGSVFVAGFIGGGIEYDYADAGNYWYNSFEVGINDGRGDVLQPIRAESREYFQGLVDDVAPFVGNWVFSGEDQDWVATEGVYPTLFRIAADDPEELVAPDDVYVNTLYNEEGGAGEHTWNYDAFANIPEALAAVAEGGTIHVATSTDPYETTESIQIDKAVTITGPGGITDENLSESARIVQTDCDGSVFIINANDVVLDGLALIAEGEGYCLSHAIVTFAGIEGRFTGVEITDNYIRGGSFAIDYNANASAPVISGNRITNNLTGIYYTAGDQDAEDPVLLGPDNIITRNQIGIHIDSSAHNLLVQHNQISGNNIDEGDVGMYVENATTGFDATENWWGSANGPSGQEMFEGTGDFLTISEESNLIIYRPFCTTADCEEVSTKDVDSEDIGELFDSYRGTMTVSEEESDDLTDVSKVDVNEDTVITVPVGDVHDSIVTLTAGTEITKNGGGNFSALDLTATNMALSEFRGFDANQVVRGAFQWGIPELGLAFNPAIRIDMYVGENYNGTTLTVRRSLSTSGGWTTNGIVDPQCVVADGICSFHATLASYYSATGEAPRSGGGGGAFVLVAPKALGQNNILDFTINNGEKVTGSNVFQISMNADPKFVSSYVISLDKTFANASILPYSSNTTLSVPAKDGMYTVFLKYYSSSGKASDVIAHTIELKTGAPIPVAAPVLPPAVVAPVVDPNALSCTVSLYLTAPLRFGLANNPSDVILLEKFLNTNEGTNLPIDGVYAKADFDAVVAWQEKYASDILTPWGISKGTGYVYRQSLKKIKEINEARCAHIATPAAPVALPNSALGFQFTRDLKPGVIGDDVKALQVYLNNHGFTVTAQGPGSKGNETTKFGLATEAALIKFQKANNIVPALGYFGPLTRAFVNTHSIEE